MFIVQVHIHVREDVTDEFITASIENARHSVQEPGIARFDLIQDKEDPTRFVLLEVYRTEEDSGLHKQTEHYAVWRDTVESMMVEPRHAVKYFNLFPDDQGWG